MLSRSCLHRSNRLNPQPFIRCRRSTLAGLNLRLILVLYDYTRKPASCEIAFVLLQAASYGTNVILFISNLITSYPELGTTSKDRAHGLGLPTVEIVHAAFIGVGFFQIQGDWGRRKELELSGPCRFLISSTESNSQLVEDCSSYITWTILHSLCERIETCCTIETVCMFREVSKYPFARPTTLHTSYE